ncbi:MAG: DoxX-like family protein [Burkholderiales bacterium]|nr:DoxX-like family protein [Opitutaceae bacterium]
MSTAALPRRVFSLLFALVWFVNGLLCKVLDLVPRHREIVGRILGEDHALVLTRLIGLSEIVMAVWILSLWKWRWSATAQIIAVLTMNVIEFLLVPDLLLFGRYNAVVALTYAAVVAYAGFIHSPSAAKTRAP